jgi:hypothetical protein
VSGDHTDTVQMLSADQKQVLAQASATVKSTCGAWTSPRPSPASASPGPTTGRSASPTRPSLKVHVGEQASYSFPVTVTAMDSGWTVEGTITIHNHRESASPGHLRCQDPSELRAFQLRAGKLS